MSKLFNEERRKYYRLPFQTVLRCEKFQFHKTFDNKQIEAALKNVSAGGILFESDKPYALKDILQIELEIPGWEKFKNEFYKSDELTASKPLIVLGSVVRVEVIHQGVYDIGVCFAGIDHGHQEALLKFIKDKGES